MKVAILGPTGQVGFELQRALRPLGTVIPLGRPDGDLSRMANVTAALDRLAPDAVVNAAAYTAVDKAESEPELCQTLNSRAPGELAVWAARRGAWLIHYSTDYVFDGRGHAPFHEDDPIGPLNTYGHTKAEGEVLIRKAGGRHLIFRTSWVYADRGANFIRTMLRLAGDRDQLKVVGDQIGAPTGADFIADATAQCLGQVLRGQVGPEVIGTYHLVAGGETHWADYARFVLGQARDLGTPLKCGPESVTPIATAEYPTPAKRPSNSRLSTEKLGRVFGLQVPPWQDGVAHAVRRLVKPGI